MAVHGRVVALCLSLVALLAAPSAATTRHAPTSVHAPDEEELEGRVPTAEELLPSVEASFVRESYTPGSVATLEAFNAAAGVTVTIFRVGSETQPTVGSTEMQGVRVSQTREVGDLTASRRVRVQVGAWPSGLYFARLTASDGRVGFAPFVVRPRVLGAHDVAVVMPTFTWQAYNVRDDDGDGKGDSWYASWNHHTVRLVRPFLDRGVPYHFRSYDLPFLHWLAREGHAVDVLSDEDLDRASGAELARAYRLVVFPGHHEYVTTHEYDAVQTYRNRGGHLMFLSANNFFWRVLRHGDVIVKTQQWRDLGRPEAALIGVGYRGNDRGTHRAPWTARDVEAASWLFARTEIADGSAFGTAGIEIDETSPSSPRNVQVLADVRNLFGRGFTAQMTYYETPSGAEVFAAGAFTLAGSALDPTVSTLLENLWARLA